jgi:serine/threonine-protein phosphatase 2A activator
MSAADLRRFLESNSARAFVSFILSVCDACSGKKLSQLCQNPSPVVQRMGAMLSELQGWVAEMPPVQQSLRYGNPAYRTWHARLVQRAEELLRGVLPEELHGAAAELAPYLTDSFGNATRIDYGTGHETTFVALLFCMARLGLITQVDCGAVVGVVFAKYLELMRCLQTTYW